MPEIGATRPAPIPSEVRAFLRLPKASDWYDYLPEDLHNKIAAETTLIEQHLIAHGTFFPSYAINRINELTAEVRRVERKYESDLRAPVVRHFHGRKAKANVKVLR